MALDDHIIHLEGGRLAADTPPGHVAAIAAQAVARGHVVLHFHGGLVSYRKGREIAQRLESLYTDAGAYPVFFLWESNLLETIENNLGEIAKELFFRLVWKRVVNTVVRKSRQRPGDRGALALPQVDTRALDEAIEHALDNDELEGLIETVADVEAPHEELSELEEQALETELNEDFALTQEIERISQGLRTPAEIDADRRTRSGTVRGASPTLMDPDVLQRLVDRPEPGQRGLIATVRLIKAVVAVARRVILRFVRKRDHGLHATVVEEILRELYVGNVGGVLWSAMKQDTADAFDHDPQVHGGTALLDALQRHVAPNEPPRITLVAHSAGSIFAFEFLDHAPPYLPGLQFDVVLLAPAVSFERMAASLAAHQGSIRGFRSFAMDDHYERKDRIVRVVYPHSLLYFVCGVVEREPDMPLVGMRRFQDAARYAAGRFPRVEVVRQYLAAAPGRAVWSVTQSAATGLKSHAEKHGAFDDDQVTLQSIKHVLANGF